MSTRQATRIVTMLLLLCLCLAGTASARQDLVLDWANQFVPGPTNDRWDNPENWNWGTVPTTERAICDWHADWGVNTPLVIDSATAATSDTFYIGVSDSSGGESVLDMTGGTFTISNNGDSGSFHIGSENGPGTFNLSGGVLAVAETLMVGNRNTGTINMDGGSITCNTLSVALEASSAGRLFLNDGTITASSLNMNYDAVIDIDQGVLMLNGDHVDLVTGFIYGENKIIGRGGATVVCDYDVINPGITTVFVPEPVVTRDLYSDTWVATDALGRELPGYAECGSPREAKFVGIFYFLWLGQHGTGGPYDITKILEENPTAPNWGPVHTFHHWGESELGYYLSEDDYVIREHAHMLADAGVDVIILDVTNGFTYTDNYLTLCSVFRQIRNEGGTTPQICFLTHSNSVGVVQQLYDEFYSQNLYPELWFYWQGKPLILADLGGHSQTILNFFIIRYSWAWDAGYHKWQWIDTYPQDYGWDVPGVPEEVPVGVAEHPTSNIGRSYSNGSQPSHDIYGLTGLEDQGLHFAEQWQRALEVDPEFIFITGWNEWVAQRFISGSSQWFLGQRLPAGETFFVDAYNQEYNRDIEPMKGGHTDNYYFQMIDGIRRFKGVRAPQKTSAAKVISINGDFSDWADVSPEFLDTAYDTTHRDEQGWGSAGTYTNTTGRNDFIAAKVARDTENIYFYVETKNNITNYTRRKPNWMLLFIDADRNTATGWEGYDYLVNLGVNSSTSTTLKGSADGWNWTTVNSDISYVVSGKKMEMRIPRSDIGQGSGNDAVAFYFHWADNIKNTDDIIEFSVSGDSAPNRRFNYRYENEPYYYLFEADGDFEGWTFIHSLGNGVIANGVLSCDVTGANPYMHSSPVKLDPSAYKYLRLRIKNSTSGNGASLYWATNLDPTMDENMVEHFPIFPNDDFRDYWVDLSQNPYWTDTITLLRLDPSIAGSGHVDIDLVGISRFPKYDLNQSGSVEWEDLRIMSSYWLDDEPSVDISPYGGDRTVDLLDYAVIAEKWSKSGF